MSEVTIENRDFQSTDFSHDVLQRGEYEKCNFEHCVFSNSDLSNVVFTECKFNNCNFSMAKITNISFKDSKFKDCKLLGLRFDECNKFGFSVEFESCQLNLSTFYKQN